GLECVGAAMAEIAIAEQKISQPGEGLARQIGRRIITVAVVDRIAGRYSVSYGHANGHIAGPEFVQVNTGDQSAEGASQVGEPYGGITDDLLLVGDVVLLDSRLTQPKWDRIDGGQATKSRGDHTPVQGAETVRISGPALQGSRSRIAIGIETPLCQTLIKGVNRNRVADTLGRGGRKVESIAATDHGFVGQAKSEANARREIILVHADQAASNVQPWLARGHYRPQRRNARVQERKCFVRRHDEAAFQPGSRVHEIGIEVGQQIVSLDEWRDQLISQTQVERQARCYFPIVLEKEALLPVIDIHRRPGRVDEGHAGWRCA